MKLDKTSQLLVLGGFLIFVLIIFLWSTRAQQSAERTRLSGELTLAARKLSASQVDRLYQQKSNLEKRISQTVAGSNDVAGNIFNSSKSISATDILLDTAAKLGVEIKEIKTTGPQKENVRGAVLAALVLNIKVEGELAGLSNFVMALGERFTTSLVKSAEVEIPGGSHSISGVSSRPSLKVVLVLYSYQGEP